MSVNRTKSILVVGGSGTLGSQLALRLRENYKVFATYHRTPCQIPGVSCLPLDVTNRDQVRRLIYVTHPDVILYAAGSNDLIQAEDEPRRAEHAHTSGPAMVLGVAELLGPRFILFSNCYTFDGSRGNYRETDTVIPATALGKAKIGGENFIRGKSLNHVIVRCSPFIARGTGIRSTWFDQLRSALARDRSVALPNDEVHSLVPIEGLLELTEKLIESGPRNRILHYGGLTRMSFYDFGKAFAKHFGYSLDLVQIGKANQPPVLASGAHPLAPGHRLDFSLNSTLAVQSLKIQPLLLEESLDLIEKQLVRSA
jgi:dTDP-4-dehydrorhamnose reductase